MSPGPQTTVTDAIRHHALTPQDDEAQLQADMEAAFIEINQLRMKIDDDTAELQAERAALDERISDIIAPTAARIEDLKEWIGNQVLGNEHSAKTEGGTCSYVKPRAPKATWDDAALNGYAANGHDELLQFRKEGKPGKAGTRWKLPDIEDMRAKEALRLAREAQE